MVNTVVVGNTSLAPIFIVPEATAVASQALPVELIVQVLESVLDTFPFGMLIVPLIVPVPPPRRNRMPTKPPAPAVMFPLTVRLALVAALNWFRAEVVASLMRTTGPAQMLFPLPLSS